MLKRTCDDKMRMAQQLIAMLHEQLAQRDADLERMSSDRQESERMWLDRVREVEDWGRAHSLDQLRGMHPTAAMELHVPEGPRKLYRTDPTGMIVDEVDPRDYDEA